MGCQPLIPHLWFNNFLRLPKEMLRKDKGKNVFDLLVSFFLI